jgi:hypothetical protein
METPGSVPSAGADPTTREPDTTAPEPGAAAPVSGPVWRFLIQPRWLAWHLFAIVAIWGMSWLCDWQLHRAISGNGLSWAYTFEWPLFAGFGIVFWGRTIRDEFRSRRGLDLATGRVIGVQESGPVLPEGIGTRQIEPPDDDADDAELASYNAYLARLNAEVKGSKKRFG